MSLKKILKVLAVALGLFIIFVFIVGPGPSEDPIIESAEQKKWVTITSKNGLFAARFPSSTEVSSSEALIPNTSYKIFQDVYVGLGARENIYYAVTVLYPKEMSIANNKDALTLGLDMVVKTTKGNKLIESKDAIFKNRPAKTFIMQGASGLMHQGVLFVQGDTLYQVFKTYTPESFVADDFNYFLASFKPQQN